MNQPPRKRNFRIEPFKHKVEMDPKYAEKTWKILEDAIHEIYNHNASGLSFEELYRNAYNMVLHKYGERLYSGLVATMTGHLQGVAATIESAPGEMFLEEIKSRWADHTKSLQMIRDILMYMDRTFVANHNKTPVHELGLQLWRDHVVRAPRVRDRLVPSLLALVAQERSGGVVDRGLLRAIVRMFAELGPAVYAEDFERPFLEASAQFYRAEAQTMLGGGPAAQVASTDAYSATTAATAAIAEPGEPLPGAGGLGGRASGCNCSEFLRRAERRLAEESERAAQYLDVRSEAKLTGVVESELLGAHVHTLVDMEGSGLVPMLEADRVEDLSRMYSLFRRVPHGLPTLRDVMATHVKETGKNLVTDPERNKDPVDFVQRLLALKEKHDSIIRTAFSHDKTFLSSLSASFEHFLNLNSRSPEFLSLFIDDRLRRGLKGATEEEAEALLDGVMGLFRHLQDKDVFEKYYKQHLAKRLLAGRSVSDDAERSFLVKLRTECGYQFTCKLEGMFMDMKTSRDMMASFHAALAEEAASTVEAEAGTGGGEGDPVVAADESMDGGMVHEEEGVPKASGSRRRGETGEGYEEEGELATQGGEMPAASSGGAGLSSRHSGLGAPLGFQTGPSISVQVLTTGCWPTQAAASCSLPLEVLPLWDKFSKHYLTTHTGRKLSLQPGMGSADIKAIFGGRKYELNVSTYQMAILLLFNECERLSYADILTATGIAEPELKRSLQSLSLVKGKNVLRKEPMSKDVQPGDSFAFNDKFSSKLYKVKIGTVAAQKESEPEKVETRAKVEEDRKPQIEAAIVRIMKSRRVLDHNNVVSEVTKQLQSRFLPSPAMIKQRIESLIEREFLERDRDDRKLYRYLA